MEKFYALDLEDLKNRNGGDILRGMRAAIGRAKHLAGGETRLTGVAIDRKGDRLRFCFRLGKK